MTEQPYRPAIGSRCAADDVHQRCLAGAIWAYQPDNLRGIDGDVDMTQGGDASEMLGHIANQQRDGSTIKRDGSTDGSLPPPQTGGVSHALPEDSR